MSEHEEQLPPSEIEAEQAVIGAILTEGGAALDILDGLLLPGDFYRKGHGLIYETALTLRATNQPLQLLNIQRELKARGHLGRPDIGGVTGITELALCYVGLSSLSYYANDILEASKKRNALKLIERVAEDAHEATADDMLRKIADAVARIQRRGTPGEVTDGKEIAVQVLGDIMDRMESPGLLGIPTGFDQLDSMIDGLVGQEVIIVAARPGMGKTGLGLRLFLNVLSGGNIAHFYSLEMTKKQLMQRIYSQVSGVPLTTIRNGYTEDKEQTQNLIGLAEMELRKLPPFEIIESANKVSQIEARIVAAERQGKKPKFVVCDHLMHLKGEQADGKAIDKREEVTQISLDWLEMCKRQGVCGLLLHQLNRGVEGRKDKRPMMSDLREAGGIEENAHVVAFIYREEYYDRDESKSRGEAELIIAKNRSGPVGKVDLLFHSSTTDFLPRHPSDGFQGLQNGSTRYSGNGLPNFTKD